MEPREEYALLRLLCWVVGVGVSIAFLAVAGHQFGLFQFIWISAEFKNPEPTTGIMFVACSVAILVLLPKVTKSKN